MIKHGLRDTKIDLPGIAVEGFACRAGIVGGSYAEIARAVLLQGVADLESGIAMEPAGRENLVERLGGTNSGVAIEALDWFEDAADAAGRARGAADDGDHHQSIRLWHGVFGDPFPNAVDAGALKAAAAVLSFGNGAVRPTRAYGDV
jgi:hypothetical protein